MTSLNTIQSHLRSIADPATALVSQRFFKTAPGQYGAGDIFLGIKVPVLRAFVKKIPQTSLNTISTLLQSKMHEERFFALLLLMDYFKQTDAINQQSAYELYLTHTTFINNWDLVDLSAAHIVGVYLADRVRQPLYELVRSASLWERRIAIIATFHFIRCGEFKDTLNLAELLLNDTHDLMHKAVGWMLREVGKRDQEIEEQFLQQHYRDMPRTMLRYAIERFPEARRKEYLLGTA